MTYLKWIIGSVVLFTGQAIVVNPLLLAALATLLLMSIFDKRPLSASLDNRILVSITLPFLFAGGFLAVMASFPVTRYIQTASILLPTVPLLHVFQRVSPLFKRN